MKQATYTLIGILLFSVLTFGQAEEATAINKLNAGFQKYRASADELDTLLKSWVEVWDKGYSGTSVAEINAYLIFEDVWQDYELQRLIPRKCYHITAIYYDVVQDSLSVSVVPDDAFGEHVRLGLSDNVTHLTCTNFTPKLTRHIENDEAKAIRLTDERAQLLKSFILGTDDINERYDRLQYLRTRFYIDDYLDGDNYPVRNMYRIYVSNITLNKSMTKAEVILRIKGELCSVIYIKNESKWDIRSNWRNELGL